MDASSLHEDASRSVLPPVGITGVEPVAEVSWLYATNGWDGDPAAAAKGFWGERLRPMLGGSWQQSGARHYGKGFRLDDWSAGVYWEGQGDASHTWALEVRQAALARLTPDDRLSLLAAGRPRRLDLARDDPYVRCRPRDLYEAGAVARSRTHRGNWRLEFNGIGGALTGLYVGSRASEALLRVYDKPGFGVRHELELKGSRAEEAGALLRQGWAVDALYGSAYRRLVMFPSVPGWVAFMDRVGGAGAR